LDIAMRCQYAAQKRPYSSTLEGLFVISARAYSLAITMKALMAKTPPGKVQLDFSWG
jgi:hypothetical protein